MASFPSSRPTRHRLRPAVVPLVLLLVALIGVAGSRVVMSTPSSDAASPVGDGELPDGTSAYDDAHAGVTELDPDLLRALRRAATDAVDDDVDIVVNSGWRSPEYQQRLLDEAVATYGSRAEAARWVATPETSPHVSGDAVDVGPADAAAWLATHGARYGLCRIYDNEPWHYELRPDAADRGCPPRYPDPTHDPRTRR
ncbi:M15 family metallopeptidase [Nocardioides carbamazepini]|uniref:M15 family metallopeptidase n=1 Tax=Nocardioides carbamazepini TaxID=2854259 RepID=UPI002149A850|nr:M15 family metallopeptidase [Nocardioides carbamazepini]MCR1784089.1 M15 family metallopeptidase [Nocardioides carbamazepini]